MTVYFDRYKGLFLEILYTEGGKCYASCEHPFELGDLESDLCNETKEAFDNLKAKIDAAYTELHSQLK